MTVVNYIDLTEQHIPTKISCQYVPRVMTPYWLTSMKLLNLQTSTVSGPLVLRSRTDPSSVPTQKHFPSGQYAIAEIASSYSSLVSEACPTNNEIAASLARSLTASSVSEKRSRLFGSQALIELTIPQRRS